MKYIPMLFSTPMVQAVIEGRKTQTRRAIKPQPSILPLPTDKEVYANISSFGYVWHELNDKQPPAGYLKLCPYGQPGDILWDTSIFMPKEACRLFLKIKSVRVERLHNISEIDAKAEGVKLHERGVKYLNYTDERAALTQFIYNCDTAKRSFQSLWTLINGFRDEPYAWFKNPFVWVVEFEQIDTPENFIP